MNKEVWKDIKEYEGLYQVSNLGRVKSLDREITYSDGRTTLHKGREIKTRVGNHGYMCALIYKNNKPKQILIHRLICEHFVEPPSNEKNIVNHKDGNKLNNDPSNLEWCDKRYNMVHAIDELKVSNVLGEENSQSKLTEEQVLEIYNLAINKTYTQQKIADMYGISSGNVNCIKLQKTWKRVTDVK